MLRIWYVSDLDTRRGGWAGGASCDFLGGRTGNSFSGTASAGAGPAWVSSGSPKFSQVLCLDGGPRAPPSRSMRFQSSPEPAEPRLGIAGISMGALPLAALPRSSQAWLSSKTSGSVEGSCCAGGAIFLCSSSSHAAESPSEGKESRAGEFEAGLGEGSREGSSKSHTDLPVSCGVNFAGGDGATSPSFFSFNAGCHGLVLGSSRLSWEKDAVGREASGASKLAGESLPCPCACLP